MKSLKSIYLAGAIIFYLIVFFILATLVPQNQEINFYSEKYCFIIKKIILFAGLNNYSHSLFLLVPVIIFFINFILLFGLQDYDWI